MALVFHIRSLKRGATTGEKKASQKRSQESSLNKRKCPELAQLFDTWLYNSPQAYKFGIEWFFFRRQARCLAQHLLDIGYPPQEMPKLTGGWWRRCHIRPAVVTSPFVLPTFRPLRPGRARVLGH